MSTKAKLLELLEKNRGVSLSGEKVAGILGITRSAVWKAVKSLEKDGYEIHAATNRGYLLPEKSDMLSAEGIAPYLNDYSFMNKIHVFKTLESTNKTAKEMALNGFGHGTVVIAESQTAGRGRRGRTFHSPVGSGLYISFILDTRLLSLPSVTMVTTICAVAVCRAIKAVTGIEAGIKWVNDILIDGRKVCGILTEGITDLESGAIDWVVAGIGINISTDGFPEELNEIAGSICPEGKKGAVRNMLAAELINKLFAEKIWEDLEQTRQEYRSRLAMLNEKITVIAGDEIYDADALDIDEICRLVVRTGDGSIKILSSGEVSVVRVKS